MKNRKRGNMRPSQAAHQQKKQGSALDKSGGRLHNVNKPQERKMRIITAKRLREFADKYADAEEPLEKWHHLVRQAHWDSIQDARRVFSHADAVIVKSGKPVTVFNIGGNKYRLIVAIHYNTQCIYILDLLTHAEYDKSFWKESL